MSIYFLDIEPAAAAVFERELAGQPLRFQRRGREWPRHLGDGREHPPFPARIARLLIRRGDFHFALVETAAIAL